MQLISIVFDIDGERKENHGKFLCISKIYVLFSYQQDCSYMEKKFTIEKFNLIFRDFFLKIYSPHALQILNDVISVLHHIMVPHSLLKKS